MALDTTNILGRGAVKDTYNLLGDGIVKLVRVLARRLARGAAGGLGRGAGVRPVRDGRRA